MQTGCVVRLVLGAVLALTGCEGQVRGGEVDPWPLPPDAGAVRARDGGASDAAVTGSVEPSSDDSSAEGGRDLSRDLARFQGAPRCDALGAKLCDDFESENAGSGPDGKVWKAVFGYLPKIDASRAARGKQSLHFSVTGTTPGHIEETSTFPATRGRLYGRMFVQFGALPTAPASAQWAIVAAMAGAESTEVRVAGQQRSENRFGISSRASGDQSFDWHTPATEAAAKPAVPSTRWTCLEWYFGADAKETRVWVDGTELASLHLTEREYRPGDQEGGKPWSFPALERVRIGWWLYPVDNPQPAQFDLWIDEVAIDDARIGCVD